MRPMSRYRTTVDFIHLCRDLDGQARLEALANNIRFQTKDLNKSRKNIESIMEFVKQVDSDYHKFEVKSDVDRIFLGETLHSHIASDLRSSIILALTDHSYQLNIIMRHFIESFVMTLWADIASNFRGTFNYFLEPEEWKPYRSPQRMTWNFDRRFPNRSIKERLERIRLINMVPEEGKAFYRKYFSSATPCDLTLLLSLPICETCMKDNKDKIKYREFHLDPRIRKTGKEDKHAAYKTDFGFVCCFCGKQKLTQGFAMGIPETSDMLDMLVSISEDRFALDIRMLQKLYSYLSEEYVHFSTTHHPDTKPPGYDLGGKNVVIWGLEGLLFCIGILRPLMNYYFEKMEKVG